VRPCGRSTAKSSRRPRQRRTTSPPSEAERVELSDRADWRGWLERNHASATGVWLVTFKKSAGKPRIEYEAAVEEALCFGWIDSKSKAVDEERTSIYFTPRRPKSNWTEGNLARVRRLEDAGLMTAAGRKALPSG
jgi:uncharacterized protein YdeI (YjbR/CyaY-like superfamily)